MISIEYCEKVNDEFQRLKDELEMKKKIESIQENARQLKNQMFWKNVKMRCMLGVVIVTAPIVIPISLAVSTVKSIVNSI